MSHPLLAKSPSFPLVQLEAPGPHLTFLPTPQQKGNVASNFPVHYCGVFRERPFAHWQSEDQTAHMYQQLKSPAPAQMLPGDPALGPHPSAEDHASTTSRDQAAGNLLRRHLLALCPHRALFHLQWAAKPLPHRNPCHSQVSWSAHFVLQQLRYFQLLLFREFCRCFLFFPLFFSL